MDALEDVGRRDPARDHVDDVGLGQHRADAAHDLRIVGLSRQRPDLILGDAEIARDVLQELSGPRRALAGYLVAQHLAALVEADGAPCSAPTSSAARDCASRWIAPRACVVME